VRSTLDHSRSLYANGIVSAQSHGSRQKWLEARERLAAEAAIATFVKPVRWRAMDFKTDGPCSRLIPATVAVFQKTRRAKTDGPLETEVVDLDLAFVSLVVFQESMNA
jgi:hypothetical protein